MPPAPTPGRALQPPEPCWGGTRPWVCVGAGRARPRATHPIHPSPPPPAAARDWWRDGPLGDERGERIQTKTRPSRQSAPRQQPCSPRPFPPSQTTPDGGGRVRSGCRHAWGGVRDDSTAAAAATWKTGWRDDGDAARCRKQKRASARGRGRVRTLPQRRAPPCPPAPCAGERGRRPAWLGEAVWRMGGARTPGGCPLQAQWVARYHPAGALPFPRNREAVLGARGAQTRHKRVGGGGSPPHGGAVAPTPLLPFCPRPVPGVLLEGSTPCVAEPPGRGRRGGWCGCGGCGVGCALGEPAPCHPHFPCGPTSRGGHDPKGSAPRASRDGAAGHTVVGPSAAGTGSVSPRPRNHADRILPGCCTRTVAVGA